MGLRRNCLQRLKMVEGLLEEITRVVLILGLCQNAELERSILPSMFVVLRLNEVLSEFEIDHVSPVGDILLLVRYVSKILARHFVGFQAFNGIT